MVVDVLRSLSGELPATATYKRRTWFWIPTADPATVPLGVLTISLWHSRRVHAAFERDCYAVEETPALFGAGRMFLLLNMTDPAVDEVYEAYLADGGIGFCTCKAGRCKLACKHVDALRALLEAGGLDQQ